MKKPSTTKMLVAFLFIDCTIVQLFVGYATIASINLAALIGTMPGFEPLVALVGSVISEVIGFGVYCIKSGIENSKNGIVYETAMRRLENTDTEDEEEDTAGNG